MQLKTTQCQKILDYMKSYGSITPIDAMREFGCMRLAARISDLKAQDVRIGVRNKTGKNKFGESVSFAEYYLEGNNE